MLITKREHCGTGYAVMGFVVVAQLMGYTFLRRNTESTGWKRMRSGDRPGLQNRRAAGNPVAGGFDPHSLPPFFDSLQECKKLKTKYEGSE